MRRPGSCWATCRAASGARYDLIVAADVFIYFHELRQVPPAVAAVLEPAGLLAFSVETHDGDGVILRESLCYAHGAAHVRGALDLGGFAVASLDFASARPEKGVPVPGLMAVARLPSS